MTFMQKWWRLAGLNTFGALLMIYGLYVSMWMYFVGLVVVCIANYWLIMAWRTYKKGDSK